MRLSHRHLKFSTCQKKWTQTFSLHICFSPSKLTLMNSNKTCPLTSQKPASFHTQPLNFANFSSLIPFKSILSAPLLLLRPGSAPVHFLGWTSLQLLFQSTLWSLHTSCQLAATEISESRNLYLIVYLLPGFKIQLLHPLSPPKE